VNQRIFGGLVPTWTVRHANASAVDFIASHFFGSARLRAAPADERSAEMKSAAPTREKAQG
jgi:hypothetical protein